MRNVFSQSLVAAAQADPNLILLTGDHGYTLFEELRSRHPDQYLNCGVAEQNMVGVAAGLARGGFRPIVYGLASFVPVRVLEQIKLDVCYEGLAVTFVGDGAGVVYSTLGASHQSAEDIAVISPMPGMTVLSPADAHEMRASMDRALGAKGPVYLRIGKADLGAVHSGPVSVDAGKLLPLRPGNGIAWIATGSMVRTALAVSARWAGSSVWSAPVIKPLDGNGIRALSASHHTIITLEEHSVHGGLGAAVASEVAEGPASIPVFRIGIRDRFSDKCGSYAYLMSEHGLDEASVVATVEGFLGERSGDGIQRLRRARTG